MLKKIKKEDDTLKVFLIWWMESYFERGTSFLTDCCPIRISTYCNWDLFKILQADVIDVWELKVVFQLVYFLGRTSRYKPKPWPCWWPYCRQRGIQTDRCCFCFFCSSELKIKSFLSSVRTSKHADEQVFGFLQGFPVCCFLTMCATVIIWYFTWFRQGH